jgi:hypothetical protein
VVALVVESFLESRARVQHAGCPLTPNWQKWQGGMVMVVAVVVGVVARASLG